MIGDVSTTPADEPLDMLARIVRLEERADGMRLTPEERTAIQAAARAFERRKSTATAEVLRGLLERLA